MEEKGKFLLTHRPGRVTFGLRKKSMPGSKTRVPRARAGGGDRARGDRAHTELAKQP